MPVIVFAGAMELTQCALEILNLALVVDLLAFGEFQRFQNFFHLFERMFQFLDDTVDLVDGLGNRGLFVLLLRLRMMAPLGMFNPFVAFGPIAAVMAFRAFTSLGPFTAFRPFAAFSLLRLLSMFPVFRVFDRFRVLLGRRLHGFRRGFSRCFLVFGIRGCGRFTG